jgi:nucleoside-diphosphate-sugar epimerase
MKCLVTGGAGFIGSRVAGALVAGGWEVFVLDNLTTGSKSNVPAGTDLVDCLQLLAPGGKIFGYDWEWAGVRAAVSTFARDHGLAITHCHDKWVLSASN